MKIYDEVVEKFGDLAIDYGMIAKSAARVNRSADAMQFTIMQSG